MGNSPGYCTLMGDHYAPEIKMWFPTEKVWPRQGNAPSHSSRVAKEFYETLQNPLPPHSVALNTWPLLLLGCHGGALPTTVRLRVGPQGSIAEGHCAPSSTRGRTRSNSFEGFGRAS